MRQLKITKQVTNREELSLDKYLHEIGKVELITAEKEAELARKVKQGDRQAFEMMVKANLRFVVSVAKQYQNQGLALPDLINEGNLGLIKAVQRFDETRGFKFISYAVWWIRQAILQALAEQSRIVRLPLNKIGLIGKVNKTFNSLEQEYQREPTIDELSEIIKASPDKVVEALKVSGHHVSMDAPLRSDEENNLYDVMYSPDQDSPDQGLMDDSLKLEIEHSLAMLSERESEVLRYCFGLNGCRQHTLDEISEVMGLTRERVRQIKEKAIKRLKMGFRNKRLKPFLGE